MWIAVKAGNKLLQYCERRSMKIGIDSRYDRCVQHNVYAKERRVMAMWIKYLRSDVCRYGIFLMIRECHSFDSVAIPM